MVNSFDASQATIAKHLEKCLVVEVADAGHFKFQQCVLPGIHIDGIDVIESRQCVGQGIATCRSDDQEVVFGGQFENLFVNSRVFPAGIIDEIVSVYELKDTTAQPFADFFHCVMM